MALEKAIAIALVCVAAHDASAEIDVPPTLIHAELDPLTFANYPGYGGQIGLRHPALRGVRVAVASFALHVPDILSQKLNGGGIDQRVRPSGAIYGLYYFEKTGVDGFAIGASIRYLRIRYTDESEPSRTTDVREISPEVIAAYQWHPWKGRFYIQPWFALGVTVWRQGSLALGPDPAPIVVDPWPVSPFFTFNLGYEYAL
jgi:hypothetical protein